MMLVTMAAFLMVPQSVDWEATALRHEYLGEYDKAVIARIEAIRSLGEGEAGSRHRRELARQL